MEYQVFTNNCFLRLDGNIHGPIKFIQSAYFNYTPTDAMVYVNESLVYDLETTQGSGVKISNNLPMFVSTKQILTKLTDNGISVQEFEKLFGAVAKLQKKEYVEQKSED